MQGSVDTLVRPVTLAFLVDQKDRAQIRAAIRICSSLWGGSYFPIIPVLRRLPRNWRDSPMAPTSARDYVLGMIEGFDPDFLVQMCDQLPEYLNSTGLQVLRPEQVWSSTFRQGTLSPAYGIGVFEVLEALYAEHFRYRTRYPIRVDFPQIPRQFDLFWASLLGELPEELMSPLRDHFMEALEVGTTRAGLDSIVDLMDGAVQFPRRISTYQISARGRRGVAHDAAVFYMDASRADDIVDFWNLRATGRPVLPLPRQFVKDERYRGLVVDFLRVHRVHWRHQPQHCSTALLVRGRSTSIEEMTEFGRSLKIERPDGDPSMDGFFAIQSWYPRLWNEWARHKDGGVAVPYGEEAAELDLAGSTDRLLRIKPLFPSFADRHAFTGAPRCANELMFNVYGSDQHTAEVLPMATGKRYLRSLAGLGEPTDWRVGKSGLVKFVRHGVREAIELPLAEPIFFSWMEDHGWTCTPSSAGLLAKQIFMRLDGHVGVLRNEGLLGLLEHLSGGSKFTDATTANSRDPSASRELSARQVKQQLGGNGMGGLHEYLLSKGVFSVGLTLRCPTCMRRSWFSMDTLQDQLLCPKCLNSFSAISTIDRGQWSYRTIGPFSVRNYAEGAYACLLTLDFFARERLGGLRISPVFSFTAKNSFGVSLEADLGFFWSDTVDGVPQSGLAFGECKTFGEFKAVDFERMAGLAEAFPGAVLVFAKLARTMSPKELAGLRRIAKAGRRRWKAGRRSIRFVVLTGTELLSHSPPPNCWPGHVDKVHSVNSGLLWLSRETQARYLSLRTGKRVRQTVLARWKEVSASRDRLQWVPGVERIQQATRAPVLRAK
jgi:hypothetical protein